MCHQRYLEMFGLLTFFLLIWIKNEEEQNFLNGFQLFF